MNEIIKSINLMLKLDIVTELKPIETNYIGKQFAFSNSMGYTVYFQNSNTFVSFDNKMYVCLTTFISQITSLGGATYCTKTNKIGIDSGYIVSLKPFEKTLQIDKLDTRTIANYIESNALELAKDNRFLGAYLVDNTLYLDVSVVLFDKRNAIEFGYKNNQLAIYDANLGKVIELPTPQKSGTETQKRAYITSVIDRLCNL